ncbi:hypothetical protein [Mycoplasmopsis felis]|uniref:hypothetical protein n=1 Tax=Mycoplasmopsis felis TaxID=33923 RepID=UPI0021B089A7|nr:hypothetical protein [Mycoplasmopsis felis]UWV84408.1 hypothetical protein NWE58_03090 [Mycoplasmopsis felis]
MLRYILQRIGFAILTLLIIVIVVFLLTAHFTENPFLKQATDLSGNNNGSSQNTASKLRTLFEKSVDYHFFLYRFKKVNIMNIKING